MPAFSRVLMASLAALAAGRLLAPKEVAAAVHPHNASANASVATQNTTNVTKNATHHHKNLTEEEQLAHLQDGLQAITKLQSVFQGDALSSAVSASEMASGAMTTELSKKDSAVWATINAMMESSKQVMTKLHAANATEKKKIMGNLEKELNTKADNLQNMTDKADEVNEKNSAEYLLGLLMRHQQDWSIQKQLNTTLKFANGSLAAWELAQHHNMSKPFAAQLATIMDDEKKALKNSSAKAKAKALKKALKNTSAVTHGNASAAKANVTTVDKAAVAKKAAKQFIQLVDSLRQLKA